MISKPRVGSHKLSGTDRMHIVNPEAPTRRVCRTLPFVSLQKQGILLVPLDWECLEQLGKLNPLGLLPV